MSEILAVVVTLLVGVVTWVSWRRMLLPVDHPQKISPPLSMWLLFLLAIGLSLATSFDTENATLVGNVGTIADVVRAIGTVAVLLYIRDFAFKWYDLACIAASLAIAAYWWLSGEATTSNRLLQLVMVAGYIPAYLRLREKAIDSRLLVALALVAAVLAFVIASLRGEGPAQLYALRAIVMASIYLAMLVRIKRIEHDRVPVGPAPIGFRAYRLSALRKGDPLFVKARAYTLGWIRNPAPDSVFDLTTWWFRDLLPVPLLFWVLKMSGRDAIFMLHGNKVVAHVFFHRRWFGPISYMFNVGVHERYRGRKLMDWAVGYCFVLTYSYKLPGLYWVQLSAGGQGAKKPPSRSFEAFLRLSRTMRDLLRTFRSPRRTDPASEIVYDPAAVARVYEKLVDGQIAFAGVVVVGEPNYRLRFSVKEARAKEVTR